jgi:hypothetical protein
VNKNQNPKRYKKKLVKFIGYLVILKFSIYIKDAENFKSSAFLALQVVLFKINI